MCRLAGSRVCAVLSLSLLLSCASATLSAVPATAASSEPGSHGRVDVAASALVEAGVELPRPVRGATAVRLLDDQLGEAAALNDVSEDALVGLLTSDPAAWLDPDGVVFFKDEVATAPAVDPVSAAAPLEQTFLLHSKPGAQRTIYLDFDGGTASGTAWHAAYANLPASQPAWDASGNGASFDAAERASIQTIWQAVAEDYAPFDVDVTTADPGPAGTHRSSWSDPTYGSRVLITPSVGAHDAICPAGCGGVAYLSVFDTVNGGGGGAAGDGHGYWQPAWVFPQQLGNSAKNIAEAISHEVGHNIGLSHDGNASQGYDTGHGAWAPIMGVGYSRPISQWSKGDYTGASNTEDDLAEIRAVTGTRADEAGATIAGAPEVPTGPAHITTRTDVDTYLLGTCAGSVTVNASVLAANADLDIAASILDARGLVVATADPSSAASSTTMATGMSASVARSLPVGTYYVSVDGVGNGPWSTGYDDYGSLGAYTLDVAGCDESTATGTPSAVSRAAASPHSTQPSVTLTWAAPAEAGSSAVTGYLLTRSGSDVPVQVGPSTTTHTWTGLASDTTYSFTVAALNARGSGPSVTVSAATAAALAKPGVPRDLSGTWDTVGRRALIGWSTPASDGSSPVTSYDLFVDGVRSYVVSASGTYPIPLEPGPHTIGVAAVNASGRGPVAEVTVVLPGAVPTAMTLSSSVAGRSATLTAGVSAPGGRPDGTIELFDAGVLVATGWVSSGVASFIVADLATGDHAFHATFVPTDSAAFAASRSPVVISTIAAPTQVASPTAGGAPGPASGALTPPAALSSTTRVVAPPKARPGARPVVTVSVRRGSAAATGKVVVTVGTTTRTSTRSSPKTSTRSSTRTLTLSAGSASLRLPRLKAGRLRITVRYLGDATTTASSASWTIKAAPARR